MKLIAAVTLARFYGNPFRNSGNAFRKHGNTPYRVFPVSGLPLSGGGLKAVAP